MRVFLFLLVCLIHLSLCSQKAFASDKIYSLKISEQDLPRALIQLGRYTGISIIFSADELAMVKANRVEGQFSATQAITILLADSGYTAKPISANVVAIVREKRRVLPNDKSSINIEELIIVGRNTTGSLIGQTDLAGSAPVDLITGPEFEYSGAYSLGNFLKYVPAVSGNSTSTAVSNGGDGTATVTLRGLPANNTLVLLNGSRLVSTGVKGDSIDLNTIPSAAIDRIEIFKDGASTIYGADAIAGVVNVILKDTYQGVLFEGQYGITDKNDVETNNLQLLAGAELQSGSVMLMAQSFRQQGLFSRQRSLSENADGRDLGGTDLRSSATPYARINFSTEDARILQQGSQGTTSDHFRPVNDEDRYNYREATSSLSPSLRDHVYFSHIYQPGNDIELSTKLLYTHTESSIYFAPMPLFTASEFITYSIDANQEYNPFGIEIVDLRRRVVELGPRIQENINDTYRAKLNLSGSIFEGSWNLDLLWNKSEGREKFRQVFDVERTLRALGPPENCQGQNIDGCVPLNLFGPPGSITEDQIDYLQNDVGFDGVSHMYGIGANIESAVFDMPSGQMRMALGIDLRRESISAGARNGETRFVSGSLPSLTEGQRDIRELFVETRIPLINKKPWLQSLDLEFSVRHSSYSDFGDKSVPKLGLLYRPNSQWLFRATQSQGFRAPNLGELHRDSTESFVFIEDPCSAENAVETLVGCTQRSDPTRVQFLTSFAGEPNLKAEDSRSKTFGIYWTPEVNGDLALSLDYFRVDQRNVVDASAQYILDLNSRTGEFSEYIERDVNGNIRKVYAPFINIGSREVSGIDLSSRWVVKNSKFGEFRHTSNATYLLEYVDQLSPLDEAKDVRGRFTDAASEGNGAIPKWKANTGVVWKRKSWFANVSVNYIGSLVENVPYESRERKISPWITQDVQLGYQFKKSKIKLVVGVNNLSDREPPFAASAFNDNYDARTYDLIGRFLYLKSSIPL
jgi:iron complex outermembrane receptor protein